MHQVDVFNFVAEELGSDDPVLHAVVTTHRCLSPHRPSPTFSATMPHRPSGPSCLSGATKTDPRRRGLAKEGAATAVSPKIRPAVEEELRQLCAKLSTWKEDRLTDLATIKASQTVAKQTKLESTVEKRLARKRLEEQKRAQQRMMRLLDDLGPRIQHQLQQLTHDDAPVDSDANMLLQGDGGAAAVADSTLACSTTRTPSFLRASTLCDQQHFITFTKIALEERDERHALRRQFWEATRLAHLVDDETSFRRSIEASELVWHDRLVRDAAGDERLEGEA